MPHPRKREGLGVARTTRTIKETVGAPAPKVGKDGLTDRQRRILRMVRCRAYGHPWEDQGWLPMVHGGVSLWSQRFDCTRCKMIRDDHRTRSTLALDWRHYDKPSDYPGRLPKVDAIRILTGETPAQCLALAEQSPFIQAA
jgi:hypothetical protein